VLSKTAEYALRAVLYIAREKEGGPARANEIAKALAVPGNYLSKILHSLARAGVLRSERGPRGGFSLARPTTELVLAELLEALDPSVLRSECLLGMPTCSEDTACAVHHRWKRVRDPVRRFFQETTVADVLSGGAGRLSTVGTASEPSPE
jgi:Rrf2 family protein